MFTELEYNEDRRKNDQEGDDGLQSVIQVAIMDYTLFPEHRRFFAKYELQDDEGYRFSDKLQFYVMDLKAIDKAEEDKKENGWLMCPPGAEPRSLRHSAVSSWPRLGQC